MTHLPIRAPCSLLLAVVSFGCGARPIDRYYILANDDRSEALADNAGCALPLVIASVMVASPYREANIVFRSNAYEIRYYNYRHWVDPPEEMLRSLLQARLAQGGLFADVTPRIHNPGEHLALYVRLNALEELDRGGGKWTARIAARFTLRTSRDERIVWRYAFDAEQPVARHDVLGVVEALSVVYNREMDRMLHSLAGFAASHPACIAPAAAGG